MKIDDTVNSQLRIVARDADLAGDIQGNFFQRMTVGDAVDKGNEDIEAGSQGAMETSEPFDNVDFLLGNNDKGFKSENNDSYQYIMKNSMISPDVKGV